MRRKKLKEGWYFDCKCSRCQDPTEYGTLISATRCLRCGEGTILPCMYFDFLLGSRANVRLISCWKFPRTNFWYSCHKGRQGRNSSKIQSDPPLTDKSKSWNTQICVITSNFKFQMKIYFPVKIKCEKILVCHHTYLCILAFTFVS